MWHGVFGLWTVLVFGLVYAAAALLSKVVGYGVPALLAGFNARGAGRIGFGMAPRCEVALLIAGTALFKGLIGQQLLAAVVVMILINTFVAPMALTALYRKDVSGLRNPLDAMAITTRILDETTRLSQQRFNIRNYLTTSLTEPHLRFMAEIIDLLDSGGMEKVLAATTRDELYRALVGHDAENQIG